MPNMTLLKNLIEKIKCAQPAPYWTDYLHQ